MKRPRATPILVWTAVVSLAWLTGCDSDPSKIESPPTTLREVAAQSTTTIAEPVADTTAPPATQAPPETIAFTSTQDGNTDIYLMDVTTGDTQRLTAHPAEDYWPTWSPDGAQIAFASDRDGDFELFAIAAATTDRG